MNVFKNIERKCNSLRISYLKCANEEKYLRALFLKISFNLMLTAVNKWKSNKSSQSRLLGYCLDIDSLKIKPNQQPLTRQVLLDMFLSLGRTA